MVAATTATAGTAEDTVVDTVGTGIAVAVGEPSVAVDPAAS